MAEVFSLSNLLSKTDNRGTGFKVSMSYNEFGDRKTKDFANTTESPDVTYCFGGETAGDCAVRVR